MFICVLVSFSASGVKCLGFVGKARYDVIFCKLLYVHIRELILF